MQLGQANGRVAPPRSATIRVASVPRGHIYVQHLADPDGADGVVRLTDPPPPSPMTGAPWWPLVMLSADWIADHADEFDVYHLHFGFDSVDPSELWRIVRALRSRGKPLVFTVHDLRDPHHPEPSRHAAALDVLIPTADALITLTPGAAHQIRARWQRSAQVIRHPHVVNRALLNRTRPRRTRRTVGIHLKRLGANLDPLPVLQILLVEAPLRDIDVIVNVHADVVTPGKRHYDKSVTDFLSDAAQHPGVRVRVHDFFNDDELWDYFLGLDLAVLAYRFGTHSGWLEACFDLGTRVLVPRLGHYHEQQSGVLGYAVTPKGFPRVKDIVAALDAITEPGQWRADPEERIAERRKIAAAHRRLYARLVAQAAAGASRRAR